MKYNSVRSWFVLVAIVFALTSCSSSPASKAPISTDSSTTSSVTVAKDIVYAVSLDPDMPDLILDVYSPVKTDANAIVVFIPGYDSRKEAYEKESKALAESGILVFILDWPTPNSDLAWKNDGSDFRLMGETHLCAIRFARVHAQKYINDIEHLTVVAFSGGARIGITAALAGDELAELWEDFAAERGGPPSRIDCAESETTAKADSFVGISGRYNSIEYLKKTDPELWKIVSPYAHLGHSHNQKVRLLLGRNDQFVSIDLQSEFNQSLLDDGYDSDLTLWDGTHTIPIDLMVKIVLDLVEN